MVDLTKTYIPSVGDAVVISSPSGSADPYHGQGGIVEYADGNLPLNVRVRLTAGGANWFSDLELVRAATVVPAEGCGC